MSNQIKQQDESAKDFVFDLVLNYKKLYGKAPLEIEMFDSDIPDEWRETMSVNIDGEDIPITIIEEE